MPLKRIGRVAARYAAGAALSYAARRYRRRAAKTRTRRRARVARRTRKRVSTRTRTLTKRRRTVRQNHAQSNHSIGLRMRARKATAMKMVQSLMEPQWLRVQGITKYDTSTGFHAIANRVVSTVNRQLPIHVWDITSSPNDNLGTVNYPNAGFLLYWSNNTATATAETFPLNSQLTDGTTVNNTQWQYESSSSNGVAKVQPFRKQYHYYTHIKMNLYGVRKRATRYLVQLVMVNDQTADFLQAAGTNSEKRKLWMYLSAPFVYSNIQMGDPQSKPDIKILRTYDVTIGPITTDEFGGQTAAVPHIQTLNWFINHNRIRRYDWQRSGTVQNGQTSAEWDTEVGAGHDTRIDPMKRVYLLIRALSPDQRAVNGHLEDANPESEPSYDIIVRNKFGVPV